MEQTKAEIRKERVTATLNKIIGLFQAGNVSKAIAIVTFPPFDVPSQTWSLSNRLIMKLHDTFDARGLAQWNKAGRYVRKGEKAFFILAPRMMKKESGDMDEPENRYALAGFMPIPVFAAKQTEGDPVEYKEIELPTFPLLHKAQEWGIDVQGVPCVGDSYGCYCPGKQEKIRLATPSEKTFFHELSHAAHSRVKGKLKKEQDPKQEIVAELAAQTLAQIVGTELESTLGNSYAYIKSYAAQIKKDVGRACLSVLSDVEKVLNLILE